MWRIALRNLRRNRRRTLLALAIVSLGCSLSLVVLGFVERSKALIQQTTVQQYGNIQIADRALFEGDSEGLGYLIGPEDQELLTRWVAQFPEVRGSTVQLGFSSLLTFRRRTATVRGLGVVPENPVLDYNGLVVGGRGLRSSDLGAVLVGQVLAEELGLRPGDFVNLTATTAAGALNVLPAEVVGIYRFSSAEVERSQVFVPLSLAQTLLNTRGVDRVVLGLRSLRQTWGTARKLDRGLPAQGFTLEARTWDVLSPFYRQLASFFDLLFGFLIAAVFVLVFFIVLQVLTLSFLERTREVGTLRALGTLGQEVFRLFLLEGAGLGLVGGLVGLLLGVAFSLAFNAAAIPWRPPGTVQAVTLGVDFTPLVFGVPLLVSLLSTVVSALLPAGQMARLSVVEALRTV